MRRLFHTALALLVCIAVPSCSLVGAGLRKLPWKKRKKPPVAKDNTTHIIGFVEMVNPEQKFVLIRTQTRIAISAGQEISAMDGLGGAARLKVTPEKKQDFLTADIVSGSPRVGNIVMFKPVAQTTPVVPGPQPVPNPPPLAPLPLDPPTGPPMQPPPLTPVSPSEFTRSGSQHPPSVSPIPPQPIPSQPMPATSPEATVPAPATPQLPPVVR